MLDMGTGGLLDHTLREGYPIAFTSEGVLEQYRVNGSVHLKVKGQGTEITLNIGTEVVVSATMGKDTEFVGVTRRGQGYLHIMDSNLGSSYFVNLRGRGRAACIDSGGKRAVFVVEMTRIDDEGTYLGLEWLSW